jgi:hypothetical protein
MEPTIINYMFQVANHPVQDKDIKKILNILILKVSIKSNLNGPLKYCEKTSIQLIHIQEKLYPILLEPWDFRNKVINFSNFWSFLYLWCFYVFYRFLISFRIPIIYENINYFLWFIILFISLLGEEKTQKKIINKPNWLKKQNDNKAS